LDYQKRFTEIVAFLAPFSDIWLKEVLYEYPDLSAYPKEWIDWLSSLSEEDAWLIDCRKNNAVLDHSPMADYWNKIKSLTELPREEEHPDELPSWAWTFVRGKKRHEINQIRGVLAKLHDMSSIKVVDIGGGTGQLGRVLALYHGIPVTSIDMNAEFQELGKKRISKYPKPEGHADLSFINTFFDETIFDRHPELQNECGENSLIVGLHTCGPLAIEQMRAGLKTKSRSLFNFACCYNKLDENKDVNLSNVAEEAGLTLNKYALTLATRGHADMTLNEYQFKKRVKTFRYTLQLLCLKNGIADRLESVGSAVPSVYRGEFEDYAMEKLSFAGISHSYTKEEMRLFYQDPNIQREVEKMFFANLIRWQMGRVLEMYILIDRVLWLQQEGLQPTLKQYFDEDLSPRNIGLLISK
jgi:SAM-dependent methyltransferase